MKTRYKQILRSFCKSKVLSLCTSQVRSKSATGGSGNAFASTEIYTFVGGIDCWI